MIEKNMKKIIGILLIIVLVLCTPASVYHVEAKTLKRTKKITLNKKTSELEIGQRIKLKVKKVKPAKSLKKVKWKSNKPNVAIVSKKGIVKAVGIGTAKITATSVSNKKAKAVCKIKVKSSINEKINKVSIPQNTNVNQGINLNLNNNKSNSTNTKNNQTKQEQNNEDKNEFYNNPNINSINHRGYNNIAPENTLAAFAMSKKLGFSCVETDIAFTSDGVPVCIHDGTVDRTSNGTGIVSEMTFDEIRQLDFGSWKSPNYAGEKIPSFEEFLILCRDLVLHPYIEIKNIDEDSTEQIENLVYLVKKCGMKGKVTWISFNINHLQNVNNFDESARLGYVVSQITDESISQINELKTNSNEVFIDAQYDKVTNENIQQCIDADLPLEVWVVNEVEIILALDPYITGITSDSLVAERILIDNITK
ncbi:MAG: hypothetical protein E7254_01390 [Lachnospiraceae bacterium]|nr:hypothetical protein [Lachnospiraceae bacterium]